jgi:hypothetical protein
MLAMLATAYVSSGGSSDLVLFYLLLPFLGIFLLMQEIYD